MDIEERLAALEAMTQENRDFWHKPTPNGKTRVEMLDKMLTLSNNAKFTSKVLLWLIGGGMSLIGAASTIQRLWGKG